MKNFFRSISSLALLFLFPLIAHSQMFWNQTAQFAGNSTSYISVVNSTELNLTGSFTLEAWVNPSNTTTKGVIAKGGALGASLEYALRITGSRAVLFTDGTQRLASKTTSLIPVNKWTHISATYNSTFNLFSIYINGVLDTVSIVVGASPSSNSDSLFIGISGAASPFIGKIDEVRIWKRTLSTSEVGIYYRSTIGTSSGIYNNLSLSMPFQNESGAGISGKDHSDNTNSGRLRNVTGINESFNPLHTISQNESAEFDGADDYLAGASNAAVSPTNAFTIECWVYPRASGSYTLISKGNSYSLLVVNDDVRFKINSTTFITSSELSLNKWSHIGVAYDNVTDSVRIVVNSNSPNQFFNNSVGIINSNSDSVYIGGVPGATNDLNGYIDEVQFTNYAKTLSDLQNNVFKSIDATNDPGNPTTDVYYGLNGYMLDNTQDSGPRLFFRNNARFSHPAAINNQPVSPVNRNANNRFSDGFYMNFITQNIPLSGTSGTLNNSFVVNFDSPINDIKLFVALNHTNSSNLEIVLRGPNSDSVKVFDKRISNSKDNNVITIFNDFADSSLIDERYSSFYTQIKPENNLNSVFFGDNTKGTWTISVRDVATGDVGVLYAWGIQFNNQNIRQKNLDCTVFFEGFYNESLNRMTSTDTVKAYLRNFTAPYTIIDSSKVITNLFGNSPLSFAKASDNVSYYLVLKHRNTIETWSSIAVRFSRSEAAYHFHNDSSRAFGNNMKTVHTSPLRYALYSGDVNQDGTIDLSDGSLIDNDAFNFASGYIPTDVNGDEVIDLADAVFADNNGFNFVGKITP
ncbi:MAG: LamG-like jellyroll fold domain-containing protein [Ignavibacteria bacterium]